MPFALEITTGEYAGKLYVLESYAPMLLGRARDADLVVPDMDTSISRYHALIEVGTDGISVRDMQGQLRTRVNGRVVNTAKMIPGDTLTLGNTSFVLHDRTELAPSTAPVEPGPEPVASTPEHRPTAPPPGWNANDDEVATLFAPLANLLPLRCSHCGIAGPLPPDPTLAGAAWLCRSCIEVGRNRRPHDPHHLGNYEILRFLAQGGMGQVYEGVSRDTGMHVAVKQLVRSGGNGDSIVQRFMREQRLARAMRHPSIVRCYDVGTTTHSMYIVTEFMIGGDALRLASPNSNVHMILSIGAALFRALEYGHSLGVVHRDVKPQNLLLGRTNEHNIPIARLTDFGLAKSVRDAGLRPITARGEGGGSLLMMGPEQLLNFQYADPSCDLFSGAALLYRLLTGSTHLSLSKGMHEANMHDVGRAILDDKRVPLAQRRSDVPDMICEILDGLLARNPSLRTHMKADQIAAFLEEWAQRTQPT